MNAVMPQRGQHEQRSAEPKTKTIVDFGGVNLRANRQSIGDNEFRWLENLHPIGPGNLPVSPPPGTTLQTIVSQTPVSAWAMNLAAIDYDFVVMASGHIYQVKKTSPYTATQITSVSGAIFTSGQTALAQWNDSVVLIVDPSAGYWYWNGSSLVAISNTVATITVTDPGVYAGAPPTVSFSGGGGSGATADVYMGIISAKVNAAGTNYNVGDVLTLNAGGLAHITSAQVKVATVTAGGVVATVTVSNAGEILGAVGTTNLTTTGGAGNGATFDVSWGVTEINISSPGSGYTTAPSVVFSSPAGLTRSASATATVSGSLNGTSIATYAGRAWIANGRTVSFTDVESYTSFAGAGGAFTIDDETLHGNITALFVSNSFMYIFGDDSVDILGDVQVSSGITSFTRQNVTSSVGTTLPNSIFAYYRSLYFANTSGFYALSGSTPQKISDNLDGLFPYIDFTKPVTAGQVMVNNILCPAFMFTFTDVISPVGAGQQRPLIAVRSRDNWFFANPGTSATFVTASPIAGVASLFAWVSSGGNSIFYRLFVSSSTLFQSVYMISRLWDGAAPLYAKQLLRAGVGINWNSQNNAGGSININTDNEFTSVLSKSINGSGAPTDSSYTLTVAPALSGGEGKYFGFTISATIKQVVFQLLAVEYIEGKLF